MLITDICLDHEMQETIFYDDPLLKHSLYIVEYDHYMRELIPWHWHNELELIYIASGSCMYRTARREYRLCAGDAIYLNPGILHALEPLEENTVSYANLFDRTFLTGTDGSYFDLHYAVPVIRQKKIEAVPIYHNAEGTKPVLDLIRQTITVCRDEPPFFALTLRSLISEIWGYLYQRVQQAEPQQTEAQVELNDVRVKQMLLYIMEHYQSRISIADLAGFANISERECYRLFRQYLRQTPNLFLQSYRIQRAKNLLRTTGMPVSEVSSAAGFESISYFSKIFKRLTNLTPSEYRALPKV